MRVIRFGIAALVAFSVAAFGTVEPWSEAVLEIGAAALLIFWAIEAIRDQRLTLRGHPLIWPMAAFLAYGAFQLLTHRTLYAFGTKLELLRFGAYFLLCFLAAQAFRTTRQWRSFAWFLMSFAFLISIFGIVQHLTFNGKLYWLRELHYGGIPFGPYVNRNHFAGFVEQVIPLGLALLMLRPLRREQLPLVSLLTIVPVGALFLSASRGGILAFGSEAGLLLLLTWSKRDLKKQILIVTGLVVIVSAFVGWLGVRAALRRFAHFESGEVGQSRRIAMARGTWHIFLDHPWTGTGLGTLVNVYPRYETFYDGLVVDHAHNDYLETLAETGVIGGGLAGAFLLVLFITALQRRRVKENPFTESVRTGALVACVGILIHSLVDFNLHIPANALLFFLMAFFAAAPSPEDDLRLPRRQRPAEVEG